MNSAIKNMLIILVAIVAGSVVNMGIVMISSSIIPPPNGADVTTVEGLKNSLHLFEPKHFIFPFLAHALGTFTGALLATKLTLHHAKSKALIVGFIFLLFGSINVYMLPAPMWFNILDLVGAYIPMAYLGWKFTNKSS